MTVQQIIDWVSIAYPSSSDFTDQQKIDELNSIQNDIYMEMSKLDNQWTLAEALTEIDHLFYLLPDNCRVDNIVELKVSEQDTVDESTTWKTIQYAVLNQDISQGYYYTKAAPNKIAVTKDGKAIATMDLTLKVFYTRSPETLTSVSDMPELDSKWHDIFKYMLTQRLASWGIYRDDDVSNYYEMKSKEYLNLIDKDLIKRRDNKPTLTRAITRHRGW